MQAGLHHLKRMGVHKLTQPSGLAAAMNQLPDEAITLAAASHIERELQITPWNLSSNFVAATMQVRFSSLKVFCLWSQVPFITFKSLTLFDIIQSSLVH